MEILQAKTIVCSHPLAGGKNYATPHFRQQQHKQPASQPASQQAATAVFQLPEAPGMQREPRRAPAQTCVREQRALSVPKKQPRGGFHPIGPSAAARACVGLWREPRDRTLHGSRERSLCMYCQGPQLLSIPPPMLQARDRNTQKDQRQDKEGKITCKKSGMKQMNKR